LKILQSLVPPWAHRGSLVRRGRHNSTTLFQGPERERVMGLSEGGGLNGRITLRRMEINIYLLQNCLLIWVTKTNPFSVGEPKWVETGPGFPRPSALSFWICRNRHKHLRPQRLAVFFQRRRREGGFWFDCSLWNSDGCALSVLPASASEASFPISLSSGGRERTEPPPATLRLPFPAGIAQALFVSALRQFFICWATGGVRVGALIRNTLAGFAKLSDLEGPPRLKTKNTTKKKHDDPPHKTTHKQNETPKRKTTLSTPRDTAPRTQKCVNKLCTAKSRKEQHCKER